MLFLFFSFNVLFFGAFVNAFLRKTLTKATRKKISRKRNTTIASRRLPLTIDRLIVGNLERNLWKIPQLHILYLIGRINNKRTLARLLWVEVKATLSTIVSHVPRLPRSNWHLEMLRNVESNLTWRNAKWIDIQSLHSWILISNKKTG